MCIDDTKWLQKRLRHSKHSLKKCWIDQHIWILSTGRFYVISGMCAISRRYCLQPLSLYTIDLKLWKGTKKYSPACCYRHFWKNMLFFSLPFVLYTVKISLCADFHTKLIHEWLLFSIVSIRTLWVSTELLLKSLRLSS